jgi:molecular chaperone DnaK
MEITQQKAQAQQADEQPKQDDDVVDAEFEEMK